MSAPRTVPLSAIVGRSRFNVRPDGDPDGCAAMAASIAAVGQLQALIVRPTADHADLFEVDDGGCRWDAMRLLVDMDARAEPEGREPWTWNTDVNVLVVNGDAGVARERSLAANVVRRQLHPVEECEAFAAMVRDGLSVERVAADFGVTARYVRQRLKLQELSPAVRAAWREGRISAEVAEVLTGVVDHAAQDALLSRHAGRWSVYVVDQIRRDLRRDKMAANEPEALYVGLDAYVAQGGRLDEQLFDSKPTILDPMLMKRLAHTAMIDEGHRIADRYGFGTAIARDYLDEKERWTWGHLPIRYTDAECAGLGSLDERERAEVEALPDEIDEAEELVIAERYAAKRLAQGWHYLGLDLKPVPSLARAAE